MDVADRAQIAEAVFLSAAIGSRPAPIRAAAIGRCPICRRLIPAARRATGAGTCIRCQLRIEQGRR